MNHRATMAIAGAILTVTLASVAQSRPSEKKGSNDAAVVSDFEARVGQYLQQRKQQAGSLPGPTSSATKLKDSRDQVRARIQANRSDAKQGDIFTPDIAVYFRRQIASAFGGERGGRVLTSLRHAEPGTQAPVQINQPYPDGIPLQSMPPTLLLKLPKLPKELQYRIVGRKLVLLDIEPNLVVDILPDAVPAA